MNTGSILPLGGALFVLLSLGIRRPTQAAEVSRPIGVAAIDVTPTKPIRLTGYASRKTNSIGVEQKLWAKALAIGGDREGPAVLLTLDNCGIAEETYQEVVARLSRQGVQQDHLAIACSHTHTGPCTTRWAPNIFAQDIPAEHQATIDFYTRELIDKLERVALAALKDRRSGQFAWSQGRVGFARNRRVVVGNTPQFGDNAGGPVDHALPVLLATDAEGKVRAIVANYACHCTTLGGEFNKITGDWAGYAQEAIERDHPGAVALITIGCGADANPSPRGGADGGVALARQHGEELAAEVKRLLGQNFTPLSGRLTTGFKRINLPFGPHFTRAQWEARAREDGINGYHAKKWLARLDRGEKLPDALPYYVETWNFGEELALVFLNGEVVVDYVLRLKRELDPARLWVSSYANYVPCYIPSRRILAEGGYEAESSLWYYDRPTRLSTNAENLIIRTVTDLLPKTFRIDQKKARLPDPKTPQQALGTFRTHADLTVELVASEPLIESPVAIDWDAQGRLWVCEMYDYPTGINPPADPSHKYGEPIKAPPGGFSPGGRIKVLSSTKHDGHYDKATLFLDKLAFPTGVMPWRKGALICAAPDILYAEDTDGDGRADIVRTNYTGFATHNYQARVNGFTWGLDGWLHGSSGLFGGKIKSLLTGKEIDLGGRDFRIKPDTGEIEPLAGVSQMGRVRDDFDNWFGNDNSTLLWHYPLPDHYLRRNPHVTSPDPRVNVAANVGQASRLPRERASASQAVESAPPRAGGTPALLSDPNQLFPTSRTLERFNDPQAANRVTSACGPGIYRDVLLGSNYHGNAFICEPVHNLIRRLVLEPNGVTFAGGRADDEQRGEFLASTDNWFRPVQVRTGPDGALWIVDMYRFVVEHPRWIAPERLKELDVRAGSEMGRIYRVYPKGAKLRPISDLTKLSSIDLFGALDSPNGPARDLAQMELLFRHTGQDGKHLGSFASRLFAVLARSFVDPAVCVQILSTSKDLGLINPASILASLTNVNSEVRCAALRLSEAFPQDQSLDDALVQLTDDPSPDVRLQLALSLGERIPQRTASESLAKLARTGDARTRAAVLSSVVRSPGELLQAMLASGDIQSGPDEFLSGLITTAVESGLADPLGRVFQALAPPEDVFVDAQASTKLEPWRVQAIASLLESLDRRSRHTGSGELKLTESAGDAPARVESVKRRAVLLARDPNTLEPLRLACIRLLGVWGQEAALQVLATDLLDPRTPFPIQSAALDALARRQEREAGRLLVGRWATLSPTLRNRVLDALIGREEWADELLTALEQGKIRSGEVALPQRQRLLAAKSPALRTRAAGLLQTSTQTSRENVLANYVSVTSLNSLAEHGAALFEKNCALCHAFRGRGRNVGPNLAEFAGKSVQDFLVAILDPNAAIEPKSVVYNVETQDGRSLTGLVRGETASSLTLVQGGGVEEKILRTDVKELRASSISLMPEGLEQALAPQDLADLIAWLKQGAPAPFGSANAEQASRARAEFVKGGANGLGRILTSVEPLPYPGWLGRLPMPYCRQDGSKIVWQTPPVVLPAHERGNPSPRPSPPLRAGERVPKGRVRGPPSLSVSPPQWASSRNLKANLRSSSTASRYSTSTCR